MFVTCWRIRSNVAFFFNMFVHHAPCILSSCGLSPSVAFLSPQVEPRLCAALVVWTIRCLCIKPHLFLIPLVASATRDKRINCVSSFAVGMDDRVWRRRNVHEDKGLVCAFDEFLWCVWMCRVSFCAGRGFLLGLVCSVLVANCSLQANLLLSVNFGGLMEIP